MPALSNKHKKRIDKKFTNINEELEYTKKELLDFKKMIYTILMSGAFIIFCLDVLFDQIVGKIFFPFIKISQGMGFAQILVAVLCIGVMLKIYELML